MSIINTLDTNDLYDIAFRDQQQTSWNKNKKEIIQELSKCQDSFSLQINLMDIKDVAKKIKEPEYLNDLQVSFDNNVLTLIYYSTDMWNEIKKYIPKSITSISIPRSVLNDDYRFLSSFPNLVNVNTTTFTLDSESFEYLKKNTNIKTINSEIIAIDKDEYIKKDNISYISGDKNRIYSDIIVNSDFPYNNFWLSIDTNKIDDRLLQILEQEDYKNYQRILIEDNNHNKYSFDLEKGKISFYDENVENILPFINFFKKDNIKFDNVELDYEKINYYDLDLSNLAKIAEDNNLTIKYDYISVANYEDFVTMTEAVKWYRGMINDYNLSPTEKLMFAYDIMKTFKYHENEENRNMARYPDKILKSGDIVCVGYSNFLREILKNIDDSLSIACDGVSAYNNRTDDFEGHERNIVRIDDDKYNIHGIYVVDATWDSDVDSKKAREALGESYTALDLYSYFLIPYCDYQKTFNKDTMPSLYKYCSEDDEMKYTDWPVSNTLKALFNDNIPEQSLVDDYLAVKRPSLEVFLKMLYNVRIAEGYSEEQVQETVKKVEQINSNAANLMHIDFFQDNTLLR